MWVEQLEAFTTVILWTCGAVIAISGAGAAVTKFWRYAHKQSEENSVELEKVDGKLEDHDRWLASDKRRLEHIEKRQDKHDEQNVLILTALVDLLGHEIDGNHTTKLMETRDKIQKYLIETNSKTA